MNKKIVVDPKVAPAIKEIFELYSTGKFTFEKLSIFLGEKGIMTCKNKFFKKDKIKFYLSNPFYYGHFRFKKEIYQGIHQPLITKKLFDEVQLVKKAKSHTFPLKSLEFPFTGLIRCGECQMMVTAEHHFRRYITVNHEKDFIYYHCTHKSRFIPCSQPFISQEILVNQLNQHIQKVSLSTSDHSWLIKRLEDDKCQQRSEVLVIVQEFKKDLLNINDKLNKLLDSYLDNVVSREDYLNRKEKFMSEKKTIEQRIETLEQSPNKWLEPMRVFFDTAVEADKIASDNINLFQKREFLKKTGSNLTLKDRIVDWHLPDQWAALRAARQVGTKVDPTGLEPVAFTMSM
ncbi:MAG: Recombinase [Candidatus Roizmanbacteria bacterium GW2011_GWA2_35_19]|uniref:Recombinase n=1 Tax=Candidatus Roizmanbacteria bacterium GW2011_GWA2_35_19 TaxID=1618478 RepID=A0A0G0E7A7_9BACT|nr:MAG: Recombinase [Candidatus Roizmanbacteria bacterium GW2011_GWA2_35_19]